MCFFKLIIIKIWTELNGPDTSLHSKLFVGERRESSGRVMIELNYRAPVVLARDLPSHSQRNCKPRLAASIFPLQIVPGGGGTREE